MFDDNRVSFNSPREIIHNHKRAPTDESISLAMEYEEKILQKLVDKFHCADNKINISGFKLDNKLYFTYVFKLSINGNEYNKSFSILYIFDELIDEVVKWIAYEIVKPSIADIWINLNKSNLKDE